MNDMPAGATDDGGVAKNVVRLLLDSVNEGRLDDALAAIHPDCYVKAPTALPWGGVTRGLDDFLALLKVMASHFKNDILSYELFGGGDTPIARIQTAWTSKATGRSCQMQVLEIYVVKDGKIIDIDVYYQDPQVVVALGNPD
jgi:ketosteroid isomerase-like protein